MRVKVCGMRSPQNIQAVAQLEIDWMGFIFYERSPRAIADDTPAEALQLLSGAAVHQFVVLPVCSGRFDHGEINLRQNYRLFIDLAKTECFSENLLNL